MADIRVQTLGAFILHRGDEQLEFLASKTRKGTSLLQFLILQEGRAVPSSRLIRELWSGSQAISPENALKTLISRTRGMLADVSPALAACIVSEKGAYRWQTQPGVSVDVADFLRLQAEAKKADSPEQKERCYQAILNLYAGDLYQTGDLVDGVYYVNMLHREYLEAVYAYVELLKQREAYNEVCQVCRAAMKVDDFDDQLHIELMKAMVNLNRTAEATGEYRRVMQRTRRVLGEEPSEDMQAYYQQLSKAGQALKFNLDAIRNELRERDNGRPGPFVCDYPTFKEFYNIQMRNLERLGSTMFLGVIMLGDPDQPLSSVQQESSMAALLEILKNNLRRGDILTRFAPSIVAMLLPTVNYATGSMVMERIEHLFFEEYRGSDLAFHYRISPLGEGPK